MSPRLPRPRLQPHAGVLALGGRAAALLQTDPPRHGAHVPGKPPETRVTHTDVLTQVMQQQALQMSGGSPGARHLPAFQSIAVVSFVLF